MRKCPYFWGKLLEPAMVFIFWIFPFIMLQYCNSPRFENPCDHNSRNFTKLLVTKVALNDVSVQCSVPFNKITGGGGSDSSNGANIPSPGGQGVVSFSQTSPTSLNLSWSAVDNSGSQSDFEYIVYRSTSNNISTVSQAETNGTALNSYTPGLTSLPVTGLAPATPYYFTVVVKNKSGQKAIYQMISNTKFLYVTTASSNGNLGGLAGADATCSSDASKPNTSTYLALIGDTVAPTRMPCSSTPDCVGVSSAEAVNWVLKSFTLYTRPDGTVVGQATADRVLTSVSNAMSGGGGNF